MRDMDTKRDVIQGLLENLSPEQHTELARAALTIAMHLGCKPGRDGMGELGAAFTTLARSLTDADLPALDDLEEWAELNPEVHIPDLERQGHLPRNATCYGCDELLENCTCEECEQCGEELDEDDLVSFAVAGVCTMCEMGGER